MKNQFVTGAIFIVLIFLFYSSGKSQSNSPQPNVQESEILGHMSSLDTSYWAIRDMAVQYIEANPGTNNISKQFGRWNYFWKNRVDSTGNFKTIIDNMLQYRSSNSNTCMCDGDGSWNQLGPFIPNEQMSGIIVSVFSPPQDSNIIYAGSNTGGLWKTTDMGFTWENKTDVLGMTGMGVNAILGHPDSIDVLFIATGHSTGFYKTYGLGVYKSIDGGDTWRPTSLSWNSNVNFHSPITYKLLRNPQNTNIIYALTEKEVHRSIDNGENWQVIFTNSLKGNTLRDIEILPDSSHILFISSGAEGRKNAQIWVSNNSGANWDTITPPIPLLDPSHIGKAENFNLAITASDSISIYATSKEYTYKPRPSSSDSLVSVTTVLRKSSDNGQNWIIINPNITRPGPNLIHQGFHRPIFEINQKNANILYLGGNELWKSTDGGQSIVKSTEYWSYTNPLNKLDSALYSTHADIRALQIIESTNSGNTDILLMGNDGGVGRSIDGGVNGNWLNLNNRNHNSMSDALITSQVFRLANSSSRPNHIVGGLQDNWTNIQKDSSWYNPRDLRGDGGASIIDYANPGIIYARANPYLKQLIEGGSSIGKDTIYEIHTIGTEHGIYDGFVLEQSQKDPFDLFIARARTFKKLRTNPNGGHNSAIVLHSSQISGKDISTIAVSPSNPSVVYVGKAWGGGKGDRIYKSTDGGKTFTTDSLKVDSTTHIGGYEITSIIVDPENENRLWFSIVRLNSNPAVYFSDNGGLTFTPFGYGLPATLPVNTLEYQKGSNDVIFAGTDVGVFRYNPQSQIWECFNGTAPNNIPPTIVTDIAIDYCQGLLHVSTFGRGIWESPLPPLDSAWVIDQNDTIEAAMVVSVNNDIEIAKGKRLTIFGTLNMGKNTSIRVRAGAELVVDGGIITNQCGLTWEGIDLHGESIHPQNVPFPSSPQGKVILKNGAIIEHANDAITTLDFQRSNSSGGVIEAENAIFRNNKRDIEFYKYNRNNLSHFDFVDFVLDADYRFDTLKPRVTMWGVKGVEFTACDFEIQHPNFKYLDDGIFTIDASFVVQSGGCSGVYTPTGCIPNPSVFTNLKNGIHATSSRGVNTFTVDSCEFQNSINGVVSRKMDNFQVTRNNFSIGGVSPASGAANTGLLVHTAVSYRLEENSFSGSAGTQNLTIGTYILDTKEMENQVYKNTFSSLFAANLSAFDNRSTTGTNTNSRGLQYLCNTQTNDVYDIAVGSGAGIRFHQGTPSSDPNENPVSAQNMFSRNGTPESDFYNHSSNPIILFFDPTVSSTKAQDTTVTGFSQVAGDPRACPTKININPGGGLSGGDKMLFIQQFNSNKADYQNLHFVYLSLIDNGDTEVFLDSINYQWANDAWELRDNLLAQSPNLSLDALWEAANTGILPDAMLMEVLVANIAACQNDEFLNALVNEIPNPLPQYMVDMLIGAPAPPSLRQNLEEQMAVHSSAYTDAAHLIINDLLRDSIPNSDSLRLWYDNLGGLQAAYLIAESYLEEGDISMAQSTMNSLANLYAYAEKYPDEHATYEQLFGLKVLLSQENREWNNLTPTEIQELETLAYEEKGDASIQAQNILRFFYGQSYEVPLILPDSTSPQRLAAPSGSIQPENMIEIKVYPNPAKDFVTFEYRYGKEKMGTNISIIDMTGKLRRCLEAKS